nr:hypothetical protein [uncultured Porphyromonas sp.]
MMKKTYTLALWGLLLMSYATLGAQTQPESQVGSTDTINIVVRRNGKFVARADKNFLLYYTSPIAKQSPVDSCLYLFLIEETQRLKLYDQNNVSRTILYKLFLADTTAYRELTPKDMKRIKPSSISKLVKGIPDLSCGYRISLSDYYPNVRLILQQHNRVHYREYKITKWVATALPIFL